MWMFCAPNGSCATTDSGIPGTGVAGCWFGSENKTTTPATRCASTAQGWVAGTRPSAAGADAPPCPPSRFCGGAGFNASAAWVAVEVPHDYSMADLPMRTDDTVAPTLAPRYGTWRFARGDDAGWSAPSFDDSHWVAAKGGKDWRARPLNYTAYNATGWYRQHVDAPPGLMALSHRTDLLITLDLGIISGADDTFFNGVHIGHTGQFDATLGCDSYEAWRRYAIPPGLLRPQRNVVAIRVFSLGGAGPSPMMQPRGFPGGLYDDPELADYDVRDGPYDAAVSPNGQAVAYTVGGVGWYRKTFTSPVTAPGPVPGPRAQNPGAHTTRVWLQFDGVYMNSDVYINGCKHCPCCHDSQFSVFWGGGGGGGACWLAGFKQPFLRIDEQAELSMICLNHVDTTHRRRCHVHTLVRAHTQHTHTHTHWQAIPWFPSVRLHPV